MNGSTIGAIALGCFIAAAVDTALERNRARPTPASITIERGASIKDATITMPKGSTIMLPEPKWTIGGGGINGVTINDGVAITHAQCPPEYDIVALADGRLKCAPGLVDPEWVRPEQP